MKKISLLLFTICMSSLYAFGQGARNIKINEVMVKNTASIVDEYGEYVPWIELSNVSYSSYNVRGMYITTDRSVLDKTLTVPERVKKMCQIPSGDDATLMSARKHLIFFLNSLPTKGTHHLSTLITTDKENWVALYDGNGVDLIDSVTVPALSANLSWARINDGSTQWSVKNADEVTPGTNNISEQGESKVAKIKREDPYGLGITVLSMGIVFFCLVLLYVFFRILGIFMAHKQAIKKAKNIQPVKVAVKAGEKIAETGHKTKVILKDGLQTGGIDKETYIAVISMALKEYQDDIHDNESNVITIKPHSTLWNAHVEH